MTPEEKARPEIDRQLQQCGWIVQDRSELNISAGTFFCRIGRRFFLASATISPS